MKNRTQHLRLIVICIFVFASVQAGAQAGMGLPAGKKISSNGRFVPDQHLDIGITRSENGHYQASYSIGQVSDENREILDLDLYHLGRKLYSIESLPGADLVISNSGRMAVFNMDRHFMQQVSIHFYDTTGKLTGSESFQYASLFGFSPSGDLFVTGTDKALHTFDLDSGQRWELEPASRFSFSQDESLLVTAFENKLYIYKDLKLEKKIITGIPYPRALTVDPHINSVAVAGKEVLRSYSLSDFALLFESRCKPNTSFRDLLVSDGRICAGLQKRDEYHTEGILQVYSPEGELVLDETREVMKYRTFEKKPDLNKSGATYDQIPWPFDPFDQVHKVWNHYEQHMGDGSGTWSYLHQGLDLEVPINEPVYAVEEGWVKLVLTIGGDAYWRVAISPVQSSGYSDGWLYAHLVPGSIQVEVGDYVNLHDYLGDIIYWSDDWGHIHFVNIRDQGDIWYYDDDEWGINFNPLLALTPITDETGPVIEEFSPGSKFGFCENETSNYLDPEELTGEVDIIARISDYHGSSEWEQPAYRTYYWVKKYPEGETVFPKTLGQILNHTYSSYNSSYFEDYAPLMYKKDYQHPSPPWMNTERTYYQILTNNNGDSVAETGETALAFNTAGYYDGTYEVFVEAWDEYGNMAVDSQVVVFLNNNISGLTPSSAPAGPLVYPNPVRDILSVNPLNNSPIERVVIYNNHLEACMTITGTSDRRFRVDVSGLAGGIYFISVETGGQRSVQKFVKQ